jgi:hypothetical protein
VFAQTPYDKADSDLRLNYNLINNQIVPLDFDADADPVILYYDEIGVAVKIIYMEHGASVQVYKLPYSNWVLPKDYNPMDFVCTDAVYGYSRLIKSTENPFNILPM